LWCHLDELVSSADELKPIDLVELPHSHAHNVKWARRTRPASGSREITVGKGGSSHLLCYFRSEKPTRTTWAYRPRLDILRVRPHQIAERALVGDLLPSVQCPYLRARWLGIRQAGWALQTVSRRLTWSKVLMSGESPPWTHSTFPLISCGTTKVFEYGSLGAVRTAGRRCSTPQPASNSRRRRCSTSMRWGCRTCAGTVPRSRGRPISKPARGPCPGAISPRRKTRIPA
jgi:hypothetical protein